ncbi:MAG: hypothetical protein K8R37_06580 [Bacteroidales bacterium]|nr:hypothetical protein [Bacteroidales bacterium]
MKNLVMPVIRRKKRRKKIRYKKITFKLSAKQKKSFENYCKARKTTPTKLIKKLLNRYINGFDKQVPDEYYVTENQLGLFDEEESYLENELK